MQDKYLESHALANGRTIFIEKEKKEDWPESTTVKYFEGVGYYITDYNSSTMADWSVQNSTIIQFDGESKEFVKNMTIAWNKVK